MPSPAGVGVVTCILVALCSTGCATPHSNTEADPRLAPVAFLHGTWRTDQSQDTWTEEAWSSPIGGSMVGASRTFRATPNAPEALVFFEFLRLEASGGEIIYHAAPKGRSPATPFRLVAADGSVSATFENPEHDFPARIIYTLHPDGRLHARIEGTQNGAPRAEEWVYDRVHHR